MTGGGRLQAKKHARNVNYAEVAHHVVSVIRTIDGAPNYNTVAVDSIWGQVAVRMGRGNTTALRKQLHQLWTSNTGHVKVDGFSQYTVCSVFSCVLDILLS